MSTNDWSTPESDVFERISDALDAGTDAVLATVIDVEGSAYRRPGAKMLIEPDGAAGAITAGCLEDEVRALAEDVLSAGEARVETWDLMNDDAWGMGVGCNGVITVLLEPLDDSYRPATAAYDRGDDACIVTVADADDADLAVGTRGTYTERDGFAGDLPDWLEDAVTGAAERALDGGPSELLEAGDDERVRVFVDAVTAPPELVVFGSGHDVSPVVELASFAGFHVTVVSFRGAHTDDARFAGADEVVSASPREVAELREWDDDTYAVVMTHNFVDDRLTLDALLSTPVPYIGMMGPRKRFEEMREAFAEEGREFDADELERVYTPVGLSLGGDAPAQIAYGIVAEVLAVANDRTPQHLRAREGPIHDRADSTE